MVAGRRQGQRVGELENNELNYCTATANHGPGNLAHQDIMGTFGQTSVNKHLARPLTSPVTTVTSERSG